MVRFASPFLLIMIPVLTLPFLALAAQEPTPLMEVGDLIGNTPYHVRRFDKLQINNAGDWHAQALWDRATNEYCLMHNGDLAHGFRDPLPDGPGIGARWNWTYGMAMNEAGQMFYSMGFTGNPTGQLDNEGLYFEFQSLFALEADPVLDPSVPAGSQWFDWDEVLFNDTGTVLADADYRDGITGIDHRVLVKLGIAPDGTPTGSEQIILREGDTLNGATILEMPGTSRQVDLNQAGDVIATVRTDPGGSRKSIIWLNGAEIARDGQPSSVGGGLNWSNLENSMVAINNRGDYAFTAKLNSTTIRDALIVNGQPLVQYGDALPDIAPYVLRYLHGHEVDIADTGDVLWYGDFNDPNSDQDEALFLNDRVLVREGVTTIGGVAVDEILTQEFSYFLSSNGRWVVFEAVLADGREGLYRIDLDPDPTMLPLDPGVAGQINTVTVLNAGAGSKVLVGASSRRGNALINCAGTMLESGLGAPVLKVAADLADGNGTMTHSRIVAASLVGTTWYLQALDLDRCRLSNVVPVLF